MLTYENLSSEKYWIESAKQELKAHRREQNKAAMRSLFQFIFAAAMILFVLFAVETMSIWLPVVTEKITLFSDQFAVAIEQLQQYRNSMAY